LKLPFKVYSCVPYSTGEREENRKKYGVGCMISPAYRSLPVKKLKEITPLALDNGAYGAFSTKRPFDEYLFLRTLHISLKHEFPLDFVVVPDIVGVQWSHEYSRMWLPRLCSSDGASRLLALVVNDFSTKGEVRKCLPLISTIFVSGGFTRDWKGWVDFAHDYNKKAHIGRCGTIDKLKHAREIGADSIDSTIFYRKNQWEALDQLMNPEFIQEKFNFGEEL